MLDGDQLLISRIENISPFHPGFAELSAALKAPVAQILGEAAVLFKEKVNFKKPGGDGFLAHQDSQAGWWKYTDYYVTVMLSIDEATVENGCLQLAAGHHKNGIFREWEPLTPEDMSGMAFVSCPTEPGDMIIFDSYTPHASDPNLGDAVRRLYFATYNRLSDGDHLAAYHADKYASYPPDIDRDPDRDYTYKV